MSRVRMADFEIKGSEQCNGFSARGIGFTPKYATNLVAQAWEDII